MKDRSVPFFKRDGVITVMSSILCVIIGLLIGFVILVIINPDGAVNAIGVMLENFLYFPNDQMAMYYFGNTLAKSAPLLLCTLSVIFAYKVGLFNIGASGQFTIGAGVALLLGLSAHMPWWVCLLAATFAGGLVGALTGFLKARFQVNEVISGIMLNWILLYAVNTMLDGVRESGGTFTLSLDVNAPNALIPSLGLEHIFGESPYVTIGILFSVLCAIAVWFVLAKTKLGYELKATGISKDASRYAGMSVSKNMVLTMFLSGCLAGLAAACLYLSGIEQWSCAQTVVPAMGFNGISAAFLGALNPIGSIFSSFFIQHLMTGGSYINKLVYCTEISGLIIAIIIYSCGFSAYIRKRMKDGRVRKGGKRR